MNRSNVYVYARAWWQEPRGLLAAVAGVAICAGAATWWVLWLAAGANAPTRLRDAATLASASTAERPLPAAQPAPAVSLRATAIAAGSSPQAAPAPSPPPPSTMVAPGVHITPLGVPPGTVPMPAGPRPDDTESDN